MKTVLSMLTLLALLVLPASAQTDTTNVALTAYDDALSGCYFEVALDHSSVDSTATYETVAIDISDHNVDSMYVYVSPSADTVGVTVDFSNDLDTWYTYAPAAADSIVTGTLFTWLPDEMKFRRYASFDVGYPAGTVGTTTLQVRTRLAAAANEQPRRPCRTVNR